MTKEVFDDIVRNNKVSSINSYSNDPLSDLLVEIYFEGYCDGYNHVINVARNLGPRIFGSGHREFVEKHIDNIRARLSAIEEYNGKL